MTKTKEISESRIRKWEKDVLIIYIVCVQTIYGFYSACAQQPPGAFVLLNSFALFWLVGGWLVKDNKKYKAVRTFDVGFLLFFIWPILMPYYLFKTRGLKKAGAVTLGFLLLYYGVYYASALIFYKIMLLK